LKKVLHREFYYAIPDISGFPPSMTKGFHRYAFIDENELNDPETDALFQRILSALHFKNDTDLKVIPCKPNKNYSLNSLQNQGNLYVICLGIKPSQIQLQGFDRMHHVYDFQGMRLLFVDSLKSYTNESSKKILWALLKEIFNQ
jgi:hypothetical protein